MATVAIIFAIISCEDDYSKVGNEVLGDVNFEKEYYSSKPIAYTKVFDQVQTNNGLTSSFLGTYNDPAYGQSVYNILSQITPEKYNPTFGSNPVLDSVVLNLPYYSNLVNSDTREYKLDSVYGNSPINLTVYKSDYFLSNFALGSSGTDIEKRKIYYSDLITSNPIIANSVEKDFLTKITGFTPSNKEIITTTPDGDDENTDKDVEKLSPRLRVKLPIDVFKNLILDKEGSAELSNSNNFLNYFRGIYLKSEPINANEGSLVLFNLKESDITMYYTHDKVDENDKDKDGDKTDFIKENSIYKFLFYVGKDRNTNIVVSSIENTLNGKIPTTELVPDTQGEIKSENNLYLRGGKGFVGVLDLFNNYAIDKNGSTILDDKGNPINELTYLKNQNLLVTEASIKLYIDQNKIIPGNAEPERIFLFNLETGETLIDYYKDLTGGSSFTPINSFTGHLGRIKRDSDKNGEYYKIRITQHVINILNGDIENIKLGVCVSQNVKLLGNAKGVTLSSKDQIIPVSSINSHEGTVIHGNGDNVPESKRLKLDIFYTKSK